MKIRDVKEGKLPPHLAKHFDKDGNKVDGEWVDGKWKPKHKAAKDVTPKGYGPDESVEEKNVSIGRANTDYERQMDDAHGQIYGGGTQKPPARLMKALAQAEKERQGKVKEGYWDNHNKRYVSFGTAYYLMVPRTNGSLDMSKWHVMPYEDTHGSNPTGLSYNLRQRAQELGWDGYDVVAQWRGEIDDEIARFEKQRDDYEDKKKSFPSQYYEGLNGAKKLHQAKEIMSTADEVKVDDLEEARDPMNVINKFLKQKDDREKRSADLAKNRDKVNQLKSDEKLDEYKPGITVLTRDLSFNGTDDDLSDTGMSPQEEYEAVKKIRWPYGVEVKFNDKTRTVRFKTAKMKTVAKLLSKVIDFGAISAGEALDLPAELYASKDHNVTEGEQKGFYDENGKYAKASLHEIDDPANIPHGSYLYNYKGDVFLQVIEGPEVHYKGRLDYSGINLNTGKRNYILVPTDPVQANKKWAMASRDSESMEGIEEGMPNAGKKVVIAKKGEKAGEFTLPPNMSRPHHIMQELRKLNLGIGQLDLQNAARALAQGQIARAGDWAMQVQDNLPREMR